MSIDRSILYQKIEKTLQRFRAVNFDTGLVLWLIRKVIFNDPTKNCAIRGSKENWQGLPENKSLFYAGKNKGLPIGNLTSQLFGNVYLNDFDHFVKHSLGVRYYGRYVDDIVIARQDHQDKKYLKSIIPLLREYLQHKLFLELHPNKIYFQHYSKGVKYLGVVIKPYRIYIANRTKGNFYRTITKVNDVFKNENINKQKLSKILASTNSYLGLMSHYKTYNLRKKLLTNQFVPIFWNFFQLVKSKDKYLKIILQK